MGTKAEIIENLWAIIDKLRGENGCPWDRKQTPESVKTYIVEEAHEAYAAIRSGSTEEVMEELGDLLFMVLFMVHLYEESGIFRLEDVGARVEEKMIRRHPHVFGDLRVNSAEDVKDNWEKIKREEKRGNETKIPKTLPALVRAYRMLSRKAIHPEVAELEYEVSDSVGKKLEKIFHAPKEDFPQCFADLVIDLCQLARLRGFRPEDLLQKRLDERENSP
ncbi:MAG: MazG family protein [Thermodesulforhabdaceae bacterium]|jgi:MazG family protein